MFEPAGADEGRHPSTGHPLWEEAWHLDFATGDGSFGGYVRLGILPNQGVSWVWTAIVGDGRRLVTVVEHEAPIPRRGSLDLRCEGLWLDLVCEEPLRQWSAGLEAFGVALDDPADALGDLRGERIGLGLDLGWETVGDALGARGGGRYDLDCDVSGEVLIGDEVITFDGWGSRRHTWGLHDWWGEWTDMSAGRLDDDTRWNVHQTAVPGDGPCGGAITPPGGTPVVVSAWDSSDDGGLTSSGPFPTATHLELDGFELRNEVRHLSPVPVVAPDGRAGSVVHGLCQTSAADGRTGAAWSTWSRPPG